MSSHLKRRERWISSRILLLLPLTVISDMLGIPVADCQQFRAWTQAMVDRTTEKEQRTHVI